MMIAPGLANSYSVKFIPERKRDYQYLLKFTTDSGQMIVPVIGKIFSFYYERNVLVIFVMEFSFQRSDREEF